MKNTAVQHLDFCFHILSEGCTVPAGYGLQGSKYYRYFTTAKTYYDAENSCADDGAWVMMPKTTAEVEILKTLAGGEGFK